MTVLQLRNRRIKASSFCFYYLCPYPAQTLLCLFLALETTAYVSHVHYLGHSAKNPEVLVLGGLLFLLLCVNSPVLITIHVIDYS